MTLLSVVTQVLNFQQCFTKSLHDGESSCEIKTHQKCILRNSLIAPWLGLHALLRWALVQTLVWELRSQKPRGVIFFFKKTVALEAGTQITLRVILKMFSILQKLYIHHHLAREVFQVKFFS